MKQVIFVPHTLAALNLISKAKLYTPKLPKLWNNWFLYDYILEDGRTVCEEIYASGILETGESIFVVGLKLPKGSWLKESLRPVPNTQGMFKLLLKENQYDTLSSDEDVTKANI